MQGDSVAKENNFEEERTDAFTKKRHITDDSVSEMNLKNTAPHTASALHQAAL